MTQKIRLFFSPLRLLSIFEPLYALQYSGTT